MTNRTKVVVEKQEIHGQTRVVKSRMIGYVGKIYQNEMEPVAQLVENCGDALVRLIEKNKEPHIWIVMEKGKFTFIDNGHGMGPILPPEIHEKVSEFLRLEEQGNLPATFDLKTSLGLSDEDNSSLLLSALWWAQNNVGLSAKLPDESGEVSGFRGIGLQAWYVIGTSAVIRSLASRELNLLLYGHENAEPWELIPPSAEQLKQFNAEYVIQPSEKPLLNPFSKESLTSGTRVEITLKEGVSERITPSALVAYLGGRFGALLRRGIRITVIDYVTAAGRKQRGRELHVTPPVYHGVLILKKTLHIKDTKGNIYPYSLEFYYDRRGVNRGIKVRRLGNEVFPLSKMEELSGPPFSELNGYADFPSLPHEVEDRIWNTAKDNLDEVSPERTQWIRGLLSQRAELEERIEEEKVSTERRALRDYTKDHAESLSEALLRVSAFADSVMSGPRTSRVGGTEGKTVSKPVGPDLTPKTLDTVEVTVLNEHSRGVQNVHVTLKKGKVTYSRTTGSSGRLSFGVLPPGKYEVTIVLQKGMKAKDGKNRSFELTSKEPGHQITFYVVTGEPAPEPKPARKAPGIVLEELGSPLPLYELREDEGAIVINLDADPLIRVFGVDQFTTDVVIANWVSLAAGEYYLSGPQDFVNQSVGQLFPRYLEILQEKRKGKKLALKGANGKKTN